MAFNVDYSDVESFKTHFSMEEVSVWFRKKLNRAPEIYDVYSVAKEFYGLGSYERAKLCLELYASMPGALLPGHHLLGYCYLMLSQLGPALQCFKKCVREGYHEDWQLVVELEIEAEEARREAVAPGVGLVAREYEDDPVRAGTEAH